LLTKEGPAAGVVAVVGAAEVSCPAQGHVVMRIKAAAKPDSQMQRQLTVCLLTLLMEAELVKSKSTRALVPYSAGKSNH
jgi:hypothetical protein